ALGTPPGTTRLHSLPAPEWHTLNSNAALHAAHLLPLLALSAARATAAHSCVLFLTMRAVPSHDLITDAPGSKPAVISAFNSGRRVVVTADELCELHLAMRTHYCVSLSDALPLHAAVPPRLVQRRARRHLTLQDAFLSAARERAASHALLSIQGADCVITRQRLAAAAADAAVAANAHHPAAVAGFAIEGLYAGESPTRRFECVAACVNAVSHTSLPRLLLGGSGAPHEVLRAVAAGVDVVEADYPFEMAAAGRALRLLHSLPALSLHARDLARSTAPLAARCGCGACAGSPHFSRGYVHHLLDVHEMMGASLLALHNMWQYLRWFDHLRAAIAAGRFTHFADRFAAAAAAAEEDPAAHLPDADLHADILADADPIANVHPPDTRPSAVPL
ncbi:unnamed protein product, partial [Agarophyton chilense]